MSNQHISLSLAHSGIWIIATSCVFSSLSKKAKSIQQIYFRHVNNCLQSLKWVSLLFGETGSSEINVALVL